jgi:uncharacterized protein
LLKTSDYLNYIPFDGKVALFSALSGGISIVTTEIAESLRNENSNDLKNIAVQFPELLNIGAVVCGDVEEKDFIRLRFGRKRFGNYTLNVTIVPTLACNMKCSYCDQSAEVRQYTMTDEICNAVIDYIKPKIRNKELIEVTWYGGEPLIAFDKLIKMQKELLQICSMHQVDMICNLASNALLATVDRITEMKDAGIKQIQITLDGPEEVHDNRRRTSGGGNTYTRILDRILMLKDLIDVRIRVNIDRTNADKIEELLNILRGHGLLEDVYLAPVVAYTPACISAGVEDVLLSGPEFARFILPYKEYLSNDYLSDRLSPCPISCMALAENNYVFGPRGYVYKCWHDLDHVERAIDHVITGEGNLANNLFWLNYDPLSNRECLGCSVLPLCMGGCPEQRRSGITAPQCCSPLKEHLAEFVKIYLNKNQTS